MIQIIRRSRLSLYAIAAMALPLAAMPLSARPDVMTIELCTADGEMRSLSVPVGQEQGDDHCVNPCHACLPRKKGTKI